MYKYHWNLSFFPSDVLPELLFHFFTCHKLFQIAEGLLNFRYFCLFRNSCKPIFSKCQKKELKKNAQNKAKHTKLLMRKKEKLRKQKEAHKAHIKAIVEKAKEQNKEG